MDITTSTKINSDINNNITNTEINSDINISDDLDMLQLSDSMFPIGMFASSNGLELIHAKKMFSTPNDLAEFCQTIIKQQISVTDCIILANAYDATLYNQSTQKIDHVCGAMKTLKETREASIRSGVQMCRCVSKFCNDRYLKKYLNDIKNGNISGIYPVSLGVCSCALGIKKEKSILILLYGFVANMTGAALRLGMIQHFEAQKIIHELKPLLCSVVKSTIREKKKITDVWQFCPHAEILQMEHQRMDAKMFIT